MALDISGDSGGRRYSQHGGRPGSPDGSPIGTPTSPSAACDLASSPIARELWQDEVYVPRAMFAFPTPQVSAGRMGSAVSVAE